MFQIRDSHPAQFHRTDKVKDPLYVITPIFNSPRFRRRWTLYKYFERYVLDTQEANLVTIECTFGSREKVFTEAVSPRHTILHVQTTNEIWIKENLINLAIQHLPEDWKYVCWCDSDITFARPDWVGEIIQQLQHYKVVQCFSASQDLDSGYHPTNIQHSFLYTYHNNFDLVGSNKIDFELDTSDNYYSVNKGKYVLHPGYVWAMTREAFNGVGGLMDFGICGAGDRHMAYALIGKASLSIPEGVGEEYKNMVLEWEKNAEKHIQRNIGYVDGVILHNYHGDKLHRKYHNRWKILTENKFNPLTDLKRDWQGLYQLTGNKIQLRDGLMKYFHERQEDQLSYDQDKRL